MLALYPKARFVPADRTNYKAEIRDSFSKIIVHITDGHGEADAVAEMWQQPNHKSSAHFVIGQDGTVIQAVALNDVAWHAHSQNGTSVGIEHCARSPHELGPSDLGLPLSDAQYQASAELVAWLCNEVNLPVDRDHIQGHAEADPQTTHEDCPEGVCGGWDWDRYMELIDGFLNQT